MPVKSSGQVQLCITRPLEGLCRTPALWSSSERTASAVYCARQPRERAVRGSPGKAGAPGSLRLLAPGVAALGCPQAEVEQRERGVALGRPGSQHALQPL